MARRRSWSQTTHLPNKNNYIAFLLLVNLLLIVPFSSAAINLSTINSISGDETLLSPIGKFELGFFRPGNSSKYYIGMWYKGVATQTVVWVANRDSPISDKNSSELKIINGNLVLLNESKNVTWSTNVKESSSTSPNYVVAVLLDDGNLVLRDGSDPTDQPIWQSFDFPTDTFLPGAKLGYTKNKNTRQFLTSWKNPNDPGTGIYSLELDRTEQQYILRWKRSILYWNSGSWNGEIFSSVPEMRRNYLYNFSYFSNENESYFTYSLDNPSILARLVMDVSGQVRQFTWLDPSKEWNLFWAQPRVTCDVYSVCGAFSTCNQFSVPYCQCLTGFKPKSDYDSGDFSGGCERRTSLQCGDTRGVSMDKQGFLRSSQLKLPQSSQRVPIRTAEECESICFNNCSCIAYAYSIDMCDIWNDKLLNLQHSEVDGSYNTINIKLASSDLQAEKINGKSNGKISKKSNRRLLGIIIFSVVSLVVLLSCSIAYVFYRRVARRRGSQENSVQDSIDPGRLRENDQESIDVPFFDFKLILAATDNFSDSNELGEGGFGPVYKAKLPGGQVVAVKRLSSHSGQGLEEFKNEAVLIAKLQHRNLVRILGYCTEGDEKIVLYEYMPNKSLDTFIFDPTRSKLLDWSKRFEIILGVARGLLYLHQDSRLRVIHRDMKTSNILLDEEMIPKISDFGLARIVGGRETEARTKRVIGTYGYMSPEYAIHGHFSIKSDVFSFGVVMLEIISGKKNTRFYNSNQALSLLGYAWNLWKEEKPLDLMDDTLVESCDSSEVLKCIVVGLLCVQDDPGDRPTMNNVVSVLSSESSDTTTLPNPKQPAFVARKDLPTSSSSRKSETQTDNELTVSLNEGR